MNLKRAKDYTSRVIAYLAVDPRRISAEQRKLVVYAFQLAALEGGRDTAAQLSRAHRRRMGRKP